MKTHTTLLAVALACSPLLQAQNTSPTATASPTESSSKGSKGKHHEHQGMASLSDQEKAQLKAAMKQIKNDPQLLTARQNLKDAQTKEARTAAHKALRQVRHDLLIKADPTLAPVLEKIRSAKAAPTQN